MALPRSRFPLNFLPAGFALLRFTRGEKTGQARKETNEKTGGVPGPQGIKTPWDRALHRIISANSEEIRGDNNFWVVAVVASQWP